MSRLAKTLLPVINGFSIKTFEEEGGQINRKPISEIENFSIANPGPDKPYYYDFGILNFDLIPLSIWGYKTSPFTASDSIAIQILDRNTNTFLWNLVLTSQKYIVGSMFYFTFPFVCVSRNHLIRIVTNVDLINLIIYGEKAFLNNPISPNY
ncbi:MAG: hypothetical protein GW856_02790 [Cyanobacteria bacterium]|nr:hypothetical protein [Cyanobacteria bacterium CG_2015-16_32_12]